MADDLSRNGSEICKGETIVVEHEWIKVDNYLPTMQVKKSLGEGERHYLESDYVLVWDGSKVEIAQAVFDESGLFWLDRLSDVVKATFWMPLPTSPEK